MESRAWQTLTTTFKEEEEEEAKQEAR